MEKMSGWLKLTSYIRRYTEQRFRGLYQGPILIPRDLMRQDHCA